MKEQLIHELWKSGSFTGKSLQCLCGQQVTILNPGLYNTGDGPDFLDAEILSDQKGFQNGEIELHISENDWYAHHHHTDPRYNSVILHVFLYPAKKPVKLAENVEPPRLSLLPYMNAEQLRELAGRKSSGVDAIPCRGSITAISSNVVKMQLEKARKEYFAQRTNALMQYWEPHLTISEAWKRLLILAMADVLGINKNRRAMVRLAELYLGIKNPTAIVQDKKHVEQLLLNLSGLDVKVNTNTNSTAVEPLPVAGMIRKDWDFSGSRPVNQPPQRIRQLAHVIMWVHQYCGSKALLNSPDEVWRRLEEVKGGRFELARLIVWLPALYLLGSVTASKKLNDYSWKEWLMHQYGAGVEHVRAGNVFNYSESADHLGVVYQKKNYCDAGKCDGCSIWKTLRKEYFFGQVENKVG